MSTLSPDAAPELSRPSWLVALGVLAAVGLHVGLQAPLWGWEVEDAGISFAYARNLADGWGPVPFPGYERVEGYSNPLWTALLALGWRLGVDPFVGSRVLGMLFGALTVPVTAAIVAHQRRRWDGLAVVAAAIVAAFAPHVIWSASGLENSLFNLLFAWGALSVLRAADGQTGVRSALPWLLLALTRPEGVLYAAVAGAFLLVHDLGDRRGVRRSLGWVAAFWLPFGAYQAARVWVFAWAFPMTYYAKLDKVGFVFSAWQARAFSYLRDFSAETGAVLGLPLLLLALAGTSRWRLAVTGMIAAALAALLLPHGPVLAPLLPALPSFELLNGAKWFQIARGVGLLVALVALSLVSAGSRSQRAAWLLMALLAVSVAFAVRSQGDWMRGFRWFAVSAVPASALIGLGFGGLWSLVQARGQRARLAGGALIAAWAALVIAPHLYYQASYRPEVSVNSVVSRMNHYKAAARIVDLERFTALDHDMGGLTWTGPPEASVTDARGLLDVPFGIWQFDRKFLREAMTERRFDMAHSHASTGRVFNSTPGVRAQYIEIPGYGGGRKVHTGNEVRRDLLLGPPWAGPAGREATFSGVTLHGVDIPSPVVTPGSFLYVEIGLSLAQPTRDGRGLQLLFFLLNEVNEVATTFEVVLGYPEWVPPNEWRVDEVFTGKYAVRVPEKVPLGKHRFGLALLGEGGPLTPSEAGDDFDPLDAEPRFVAGELVLRQAVTLTKKSEMGRAANAEVDRALAEAAAGRCERAEVRWAKARHYRVRSYDWQASHQPTIWPALASCWSMFAAAAVDDEAAVVALERARHWDPGHASAWRVGAALGARLHDAAVVAEADGDIEQAYQLATMAVRADPTRAWSRRRAERLRATRLGLPW